MSLARTLANAVGFQAVWFASVAGAGHGLGWAGPAAALAFAIPVLAWGGQRRADLRLLAWALPLGFAVDSVFAATGLLAYDVPWPSAQAAPAWIVAMWAGFALTLNHSMAWMRDRPWLAAGFGLVGGPLAYIGAARLFDAVVIAGTPALVGLAVAWALVMPLLYAIARRAGAGAGAAPEAA